MSALGGPDGVWVCETCGFQAMKAVFRASDGVIGVDVREVHDICPNDGTSLRRQTWKEAADEAVKNAVFYLDRAASAEARVQELLAALKQAERVMADADLDHQPTDDEGRQALEAVRAAIAKAEGRS